MNKAKVFEETYQNYLQALSKIDFQERAERLGGQFSDRGIILTFFNKKYFINTATIEASGTDSIPSFAVKVVLCKYILMCPPVSAISNAEHVTFRDFKDSGPLHSYFANNTNKIIEHTFTGDLEKLRARCEIVGGNEQSIAGYDVSFTFMALPRIPIMLNYNDRDDMFAAKASILFQADAENYLDMECLAITATYLTGLLIQDSSISAKNQEIGRV